MRDSEIRSLTWSQIDWQKKILTVGKSVDHSRWYTMRFGETKPEWFVFPGGGRSPKDPKVPITSLKTAWDMVREKAGVAGRWHDNRHTLISELGESGAGDETIMEIAGHAPGRCSRGTAISARRPRGGRWRKCSGEAANAELPVSTLTQ
jgi:integrase